jgi:hypothetical protein
LDEGKVAVAAYQLGQGIFIQRMPVGNSDLHTDSVLSA